MKRIICFMLVLLFCIANFVPVSEVHSASLELPTSEDSVLVNNFCDKIVNCDFVGNGVIYVTMHHHISDVGKVYTEDDFPELDIEKIEDITGVNLSDKKEDYSENFKNVLKITLIDKSRENVISAIFALQNRAAIDIYWAEPAYFTKLLDVEDDSVTNEQSNIVNDTNEYWKEIIQYYQAISYLEDNGVDLSKK